MIDESEEEFIKKICRFRFLKPKEINAVDQIEPSPLFWCDGEEFRFFIRFKDNTSETSVCYSEKEECQKDRLKLINIINREDNP